MDTTVSFCFRNKAYSCNIYIDSSEVPCYVFVVLLEKEMIEMFGSEITIKTDFTKCLPRRNDYPDLVEIEQVIFNNITDLPEFTEAANRIEKNAEPWLEFN